MNRAFFSSHADRICLWLGGSALALLAFVRITRELIEGDVDSFDQAILGTVATIRSPRLTVAAVDITALGSITLVVLFSAFTLVVLLVVRDRWGTLQMFAASAGAGILTRLTKDVFERIRPDEVQRLVVVSGFSYPSGHSASTAALYLTIAIIAARHVQQTGARVAIFVAVSTVFDHDWRFSRLPRRSLCHGRCERHRARCGVGIRACRSVYIGRSSSTF
jgi:undecaprenyl-diphosphatase